MRFVYLVFSSLLGAFIFLSYTPVHELSTRANFMEGEKELHLPAVPFDYKSIALPDHLRTTDHSTANPYVFVDLTDEIVTLGRVLFYDEQLSVSDNISCATCHLQELSFADDTPYSLGVNELTKRNTPQLNDLAWANKEAFFWDMSQSHLEGMIILPLTNENELGITDWEQFIDKLNDLSYYPALAEAAFGEPELDLKSIRIALTQFIESMTTFNSKFDQVQRGEAYFSGQQALGLEVFKANCEVCHSEGRNNLIGDDVYPDKLLAWQAIPIWSNRKEWGDDPGAGVWKWYMEGGFKIPTLRNVALTAPYMHDGRFANLREVIDHYSYKATIGEPDWSLVPVGGFNFTQKERYALEAFLETLTDKNITEHEKWSDPFVDITSNTEVDFREVEVAVYPNPSRGLTYLSFDNPSSKKIRVDVINRQGQVLRKLSTNTNGLEMDVSTLAAGTYFLHIRNGAQAFDKPLIVQ